MATTHNLYKQNALVIFWVGVLTGALIVGLVFLSQALNADNYKSALLKVTPTVKTLTVPKTTLNTTSTTLNGASIIDPTITTSMGDPGGGL